MRTNHADHEEPTLGCLDCAAKPEWADAYYQLALEDGRRIVEAAERTKKARREPAQVWLPWWRKLLARIEGRR